MSTIINVLLVYIGIAILAAFYDYFRWNDPKFGRSFPRLLINLAICMFWPIVLGYTIYIRLIKKSNK